MNRGHLNLQTNSTTLTDVTIENAEDEPPHDPETGEIDDN
jgi:hypothetical protein